MSEYQYYEFLAVDRPLTPRDLEQIRGVSSRATLSPTQFVNTYEWGDFRGNPDDFLARYYDLMVYVANWGTRQFMIALPEDLADAKAWRPFTSSGVLALRSRGPKCILEFCSDLDEPEDDFDDGSQWMASLAPIRAELLAGDTRPLYLAWLAGIFEDSSAPKSTPAPPPGLATVTPAQQTLATFLRVDQDLLAAATALSQPLHPTDDTLAAWIASLPQDEKDRLLYAVASNRDPHVGTKLLRRYRDTSPANRPDAGPKVSDLLQSAAVLREKRRIAEQEQAQRERTRRRAREAAAREQRIATLRANPEAAWQSVEQILHLKDAKSYPDAVKTLRDLHELAAVDNTLPAFTQRLDALRHAYRHRPAFIQHLRKADLIPE